MSLDEPLSHYLYVFAYCRERSKERADDREKTDRERDRDRARDREEREKEKLATKYMTGRQLEKAREKARGRDTDNRLSADDYDDFMEILRNVNRSRQKVSLHVFGVRLSGLSCLTTTLCLCVFFSATIYIYRSRKQWALLLTIAMQVKK